MQFEIYFENLNKEAQTNLCETFNTTPEDENWGIMPLTVISREPEDENDKW